MSVVPVAFSQISPDDYARRDPAAGEYVLAGSFFVPGLALASVDRPWGAAGVAGGRVATAGLMAGLAFTHWNDFEDAWRGDLAGADLERMKRNAAFFVGAGTVNVALWVAEAVTAGVLDRRRVSASRYLEEIVYSGQPARAISPERTVWYLRSLSVSERPDGTTLLYRVGSDFLFRQPLDPAVPEIGLLTARAAAAGAARTDRTGFGGPAIGSAVYPLFMFPEAKERTELFRVAREIAAAAAMEEATERILAAAELEAAGETAHPGDRRYYAYVDAVYREYRRSRDTSGGAVDVLRALTLAAGEGFLRIFPDSEHTGAVYCILAETYGGGDSAVAAGAAALLCN